MKKNILLLTFLLVSGMSTAMYAQAGLPAPLADDNVRATYGDNAQSKNTLTTNIAVSTHIDDNALNDNSNKITDAISSFQPSFIWNFDRPRWSFQSDYSPSFSYSLQLPRYNQVSHSMRNSFSVSLAQHLQLRFRNDFTRTDDPFGRLTDSQAVPGFGVLDRPNPALFGPPTLYTGEQTGMDLTYMPVAHTTLGVSGTYADHNYEDLVLGYYNRDTHVVQGRAFVDQKLSPRQSASVAYDYQIITSTSFGRTVTHSAMLFDNWQFNKKVKLSVFAGPQYTIFTQGGAGALLGPQSGLSYIAGGTVGWTGKTIGISGNVVHRVTDGGGLGGAVQLTTFTGDVSRRLTKRLSANFNVGYTMNDYSGVLGSLGSGSANYFSGGATFDYQIMKDFSATVRYWYQHQDISELALLRNNLIDNNRVEIGLRYTFVRSLGR